VDEVERFSDILEASDGLSYLILGKEGTARVQYTKDEMMVITTTRG